VSAEDGKLRPDMVVACRMDAKSWWTENHSTLPERGRGDGRRHRTKPGTHAVKYASACVNWPPRLLEPVKNARTSWCCSFPVTSFCQRRWTWTELLEDALKQKSFSPHPQFVASARRGYGWRQEALAANADLIREVARPVQRLAVFTEHFPLGGSLEGSVTPSTRRSLVRQQSPAGARNSWKWGLARKSPGAATPLEITPRAFPRRNSWPGQPGKSAVIYYS